MTFLDDVDSLKAKVGIGSTSPLVLFGLCAVIIAVVLSIGFIAWGSFTSPGIVLEHSEESSQSQESDSSSSQLLYVHIAGEVSNPGMYELKHDARVSDAINAAGGFTENADQLSVNLARQVTDGEQIVVQAYIEAEPGTSEPIITSDSGLPSSSNTGVLSGKVNINTASASELITLDGVGESTAAKIIAYRQANGSFASIEEIKKVSGIGDKKYEAIKDRITV